ncbi:hypothetical protein CH76_10270 [Lysinibacillus sp. BF-4]|uniref:hypothetical protein n=1 Tax=Lysinibacillus sp. BF-4 TaxID=1473546 RepID=UPI000507A6EE|nr:hypothetical protein [Lysinibacillus sp. BF-4]KFL42825.1 hypothetical protein CH76_10270 [Lysinibacillus sp. BF-4]
MTKPFKTLSTAALAAVFASSALVPVASAEAPAAAASVEKVVVEQDGKLIEITQKEYIDLFLAGKEPKVKFITLNDEKTYTVEQYTDAFLSNSLDNDKALEQLSEKATAVTPENVLPGKVNEDGQIVADETPEEKVNETFFYNLAA